MTEAAIYDDEGRCVAIYGMNKCDDCEARKPLLYAATMHGERRFYCRLCYGYHNSRPAPEVTADDLRQEFLKLLGET